MLTGRVDPAAARGRWTWFVAFGIVFVVLGILALGNLVAATLVTTVVLGFLLIFAGVAQLVGAFTSGGGLGMRVLMGLLAILYMVVGVELVADPLQGAVTVAWVVGLFMVVGGVIRVILALVTRGEHRILSAIVGTIDALLGAWLLTGMPFTAPAIGLFVGIDLLLGGITWIILGWQARTAPAA